MSKEIPLSRGLVAIVDDEDFEWLNRWKWCAVNTARKGSPPRFYAARVEDERMILMHRRIMAPRNGLVVDHDDGDTLNNQRSNLIVCTQRENCQNRHDDRPIYEGSPRTQTSAQKGVTWNKRSKKWIVQINRTYIGRYNSEEDAINVAKQALGEV